ncbi:MAG: rRNA maturation RNase YbeY [Phycisphaerales bacterium]|nr:rRNA maturation RNase YbeY [Phycisphaerales bacterium]
MTKRSRRRAAPAPDRPRPGERPHSSRSIEVQVRSTVRRGWVDTNAIADAAHGAARAEGFRAGTLSIAIVGRAAMARLHADHSGDPTPTDVLTFDLGCDSRRGHIDGEIIVCADVAYAAARRRGALAELVLYVVHGVLHLAGHDDHADAAYRRMHRREDEILTALGWGPVFAKNSPSESAARTRR